VVAGRCYHLAQSGHGDASFCLDAEDREAYEQIFFEAALGLGLFVHGWAVVGREAILHSDLMGRVEQASQGGRPADATMVCGELEDLLYEKLLVEQGRLDSVIVEEAQVIARS
jgi:hypothetical protein